MRSWLQRAEGKTPPHEWSYKVRWRAGILDLAHPEAGLKQAFDILESPCWAGPEAIRVAIHKVGED